MQTNSLFKQEKIFEGKRDEIIFSFFYQDAFFNPEMTPDLASRSKLNLENFLKVLLSLALELVKTHLLTNLVLLCLPDKLDNFNIAFHFITKDKFSFLTILFKII